MDGGAWQVAVHGVATSRTQLSDFTFTFHFHALAKEMATHSSVLAWRIPGSGSLVGCRLWGRTESDTTEATQQQQQSTLICYQIEFVNILPSILIYIFIRDIGLQFCILVVVFSGFSIKVMLAIEHELRSVPSSSVFGRICEVSESHSVLSSSLGSHVLQPTSLLCPWNSLGQNTGVGSRCLLRQSS